MWFLTFGALIALPLFANSADLAPGSYEYQGIECSSSQDIASAARSANEEIRFGNESKIARVSPEKFTLLVRRYSFDRYGQDHCLATIDRKMERQGAEITLALIEKKLLPQGEYGELACRKIPVSEKPIVWRVKSAKDSFSLYQDPPLKSAQDYCKSGPVYFAYKRTESPNFPSIERAKVGAKEQVLRAELEKNPQGEIDHERLVFFLFGELRFREANAALAEFKARFPSSNVHARLDEILKKRFVAADPATGDKQFIGDLAQLSLTRAQEYLEPLRVLGEQMSASAKALAEAPGVRLSAEQKAALEKTPLGKEMLAASAGLDRSLKEIQAASDPKEMERRRKEREGAEAKLREEFKRRYSLVENVGKQYASSIREVMFSVVGKSPAEAEQLLNQANNDFPESPIVAMHRALYLAKSGNVAKAEPIVKQSLEKYPNEVILLLINDYLQRFKNAKSDSERSTVELEFLQDRVVLNQAINEAKRMPSSR